MPAFAHEDPDLQIDEVTRHLSTDPTNASLYLRRGQLYRTRAQWPAAIADFQSATRLEPDLVVVELALAETLLDAGNLPLASAAADRYLAAAPDDPAGHLVLGRILASQGTSLEAVASFTRGIELARMRPGSHGPQPDDYLARARALAAAGDAHLDEAIAGLDEGLAELAGAVSLELLAVDLETRRQHWDAALARVARIESRAQRKERWIARRAEILAAANRNDEARREFQAALSAIESLPPNLRSTAATVELAESLRRRLDPGLAAAAAQPTILTRLAPSEHASDDN